MPGEGVLSRQGLFAFFPAFEDPDTECDPDGIDGKEKSSEAVDETRGVGGFEVEDEGVDHVVATGGGEGVERQPHPVHDGVV